MLKKYMKKCRQRVMNNNNNNDAVESAYAPVVMEYVKTEGSILLGLRTTSKPMY